MDIEESIDTMRLIEFPEREEQSRYGGRIDIPGIREQPGAKVDLPEVSKTAVRSRYLEKMGWHSPEYTTSRFVQLDVPTVLNNRCIAVDNGIEEVEIYRILRSRILKHFEEKCHSKTLMVTSAVQYEGKTTTSINLAISLARDFSQTALLLDCDFRQQDVHRRLAYHSDKGLADFLLYDTPLSDLVVWPNIEKLTVISGGKPVEECSELLGSPGMRHLVGEIKNRYPERYVVFDAPPVLTCSDAMALAPLVDGIVVVVRAGKTTRKEIAKTIDLLPKDKIVGIVLNRIPANV